MIDLEFHCGNYHELWEAMIALKEEFSVQLPQRRASWYAKQERQRPVRDAIDEVKFYVARRRLYRRFFEPIVLAGTNEEERAHDAQIFWELTEPLACHLIAHMMGGYRGGR